MKVKRSTIEHGLKHWWLCYVPYEYLRKGAIVIHKNEKCMFKKLDSKWVYLWNFRKEIKIKIKDGLQAVFYPNHLDNRDISQDVPNKPRRW